MQLQKKNESLSSALLRWSLDFNENLELDKKDSKTIENYMNVINKLIEYVSKNTMLDEKEFLSTIEETNKISPELKPYIAYYITSLSKIRRLGII